jgi:hypothetical protein
MTTLTRNLPIATALLASSVLLFGTVVADPVTVYHSPECGGYTVVGVQGTPEGNVYLVHDDNSTDLWVYYDSDGDGLHRGGSSFLVPGDNEICTDDSPNGPDTLIL